MTDSPLTRPEQERVKLMKARRDFSVAMDHFHLAIQAAILDPARKADRDDLVAQGVQFRARFGDYMHALADGLAWACAQPGAGTIKEPQGEPVEPF